MCCFFQRGFLDVNVVHKTTNAEVGFWHRSNKFKSGLQWFGIPCHLFVKEFSCTEHDVSFLRWQRCHIATERRWVESTFPQLVDNKSTMSSMTFAILFWKTRRHYRDHIFDPLNSLFISQSSWFSWAMLIEDKIICMLMLLTSDFTTVDLLSAFWLLLATFNSSKQSTIKN